MTHPYWRGPWPRAFAHRGWHIDELDGMENALAAFRRAVAEGFSYLETDVHVSSDGVAVVHHDATLDRTTDRRGTIGELPWQELRHARIGGREPLSRLDDLLEELPTARLNIDVKTDAAVQPVLRTVRQHNAWDRVCLAAFDDRRLAMLRNVGEHRLLTSMGPRSVTALWAASRVPGLPLRGLVRGAAAQVPPEQGWLRIVDRAFLRTAHRWNTEVHVWTINEPKTIARLLDDGVDGIVTDRPDLLRAALRQRGQWSAANESPFGTE